MDAIKVHSIEQLGDLVRRTRKASGLRQDQLAGVANVGLRFIVDLERGKPTAQVGKVLQVLATLGCTLTYAPPVGLDLDSPSKPRTARGEQ